ncbi:hypothetical protein EZS27_015939 [termite gut metagenome]|uniref:NACHT domain-containing protein n=1 Tax=termite gut metagenome TaxID=433724 RepID=A0A5J4RQH4_9ZZZZ
MQKSIWNIKEGYFPVYFNLRNFKRYSKDSRLGVISDFLLSDYGIGIENECFKNKKYIFLIDSLDESGELTKDSIEKVINSVTRIENIDQTKCRSNQIIISSRPISDGLENQLRNHSPYTKSLDNRSTDYFLSLYGFKKDQFNKWLYNALKMSEKEPDKIENVTFVSKIFDSINNGKEIDIYTELLKNNTLGISELRRPIFAYMIYQLIINNIDFLKVGRIGIYLSFINLLTKDAKHIKDPNYRVKLEEEFQFRNILHATAALWMYESRKGKQGELKKSTLCKVIEGRDNNETDNEILERNKNKGIVEIEFLSHSYFGEDANTLHFQHQSFAEMLLAEYYLKIFIKHALDKETNIEEARTKLHLGKPTEQTIIFFIELLNLLKDTISLIGDSKNDSNILEKRKLLFPLFASISNKKNNTLFSNDIYYNWYMKFCQFSENQIEYPEEALRNWCLNEESLKKIVILAATIINSDNEYILSKVQQKSSLYNNEVVIIQENNISSVSNYIDKWLSLLVGNHLYNDLSDINQPKLFNTDYKINYNKLLVVS